MQDGQAALGRGKDQCYFIQKSEKYEETHAYDFMEGFWYGDTRAQKAYP